MKLFFTVLLTTVIALNLCGCALLDGFKEGVSNDDTEIPAGQYETEVPANTEEPAAEENAQPSSVPEEEVQPEENAFAHPVEAYFPENWAGRYVLEWDETSVNIYCKAAYGEEMGGNGWLCSIVWVTDPDYMTAAFVELGQWEGYPVWKVERSDVPMFSTEEIFAEWVSMLQDTAALGDTLREVLETAE